MTQGNPDDIPQDVWDAAMAELNKPFDVKLPGDEDSQIIEATCRAIMAERERCAGKWLPIESAPLGEMVWLWSPAWRHAFPGRRNGDYGACYIDTCEPEARGWQTFATYWQPLPPPPNGDVRG